MAEENTIRLRIRIKEFFFSRLCYMKKPLRKDSPLWTIRSSLARFEGRYCAPFRLVFRGTKWGSRQLAKKRRYTRLESWVLTQKKRSFTRLTSPPPKHPKMSRATDKDDTPRPSLNYHSTSKEEIEPQQILSTSASLHGESLVVLRHVSHEFVTISTGLRRPFAVVRRKPIGLRE
ncbi:hypothetical protein TNCV_3158971 [Trichonephila clavipes]|nr:hypothetical protein TNCV_3158971 [Trichonephila clavipes]